MGDMIKDLVINKDLETLNCNFVISEDVVFEVYYNHLYESLDIKGAIGGTRKERLGLFNKFRSLYLKGIN